VQDVPLNGTLKETAISKVLIAINRKRLTGTLEITHPNYTKKVYFDKGDAIFAASTYTDDRLGEMLLKAGKISVEHYDKAVDVLTKTKKRLGGILVELGYLTPKDLYWGVKYQVREIIYSLFILEDGEYAFTTDAIPSDEVITLKMSMGTLIYEGVKRIDNWTRIKQEMPSMKEVLMLSNDPFSLFQNIELSQQDRKILSLIDGTKTIKEIIDSSWIGSFEALKILYVLYSTGLIMRKEGGEEKEPEGISINDLLSGLSEEERTFGQRVDEYLSKVATADYFEILESDIKDDASTIKKNYFRLVKEFHPDKYYNAEDRELKDKLTTIFDYLTKAYNNLHSQEKIDTYRLSLTRGSEVAEAESEFRAEEARKKAKEEYQKGIALFKKKDFKNAAGCFVKATEHDVRNARYWNYLSLTYSKNQDSLKKAEDALMQAIKLEPENADFLVNLGLIYLKAGVPKRARTQFQKALLLDPKNEKAQKGLKDIS